MTYQKILFQWALAALITTQEGVWSWIPPHPNSTIKWEPVHEMRRRLQQPFNYKPSKFIHPEMCRYLTEDECKDVDQSMQEHIRDHKSLQVQLRNNPNLGSINVLVLMIRFSDHLDRELVTKADVEDFWNTKAAAWFDAQSQGRYDVSATVIDWTTTDNTEEYYSFGKQGTVPQAQQMAWPALDDLDASPDFDFSKFDLDGNGRIDSLVIIHSGYGAETTTTDCFGADYNNRIWAHAFSSSSRDTWKSKDGSMKVNGYTMASALDSDCGAVPAKIGVPVHEYMHTFGLEDLYDGVNALEASGIGAFDIMAYPYGQKDDANNPGHLSVYSKIDAEWVDPVDITAGGEFTLKASEISDEAYKIPLVDYGVSSEYLLIENRQPLEFDVDIWGEGLVIYHVDTGADFMNNRGYPGQDGWPENGNHYFVALLPKDGNYDLEKGNNTGDAGDMWAPGDCLRPGDGGKVYPNTDIYGFGDIQETGIWLCVKSQTGTDVTFEVGGFDGESVPESLTATQAPTIAPGAATNSPTVATLVPTVATINPTAATIAPAAATATASPTQVPSKVVTSIATTTAPNSVAPTPSPNIQTPIPSIAQNIQITPSVIPFGSEQEITRKPLPGYLPFFGPFSELGPSNSPDANPYLSNFDGMPASPALSSNVVSVSSPTTKPYLSDFGSTAKAQRGPPKLNGEGGDADDGARDFPRYSAGVVYVVEDADGAYYVPGSIEDVNNTTKKQKKVFLSSIYTSYSSATCWHCCSSWVISSFLCMLLYGRL